MADVEKKAVVVMSGGMDSTTLLYYALHEGYKVDAVSFDYGQRHKKELDFAKSTCDKLNVSHRIVDLTNLNGLLQGSALTSPDIEVPEGHYAQENMRITVVPNRNAIMLSIATGYAVSQGSEVVMTGVHAGDHAIYPDCRPEFIEKMSETMRVANEGFGNPRLRIEAPFVQITKADIAKLGDDLGVNWEETWSCYKGGEKHCGKCGTCVERIEAFQLAGVKDPTQYE